MLRRMFRDNALVIGAVTACYSALGVTALLIILVVGWRS